MQERDLLGLEIEPRGQPPHALVEPPRLGPHLGEDLAGPGEILLTTAAHGALEPGRFDFEPKEYSVSGLTIPAFRFVRPRYDLEPDNPR